MLVRLTFLLSIQTETDPAELILEANSGNGRTSFTDSRLLIGCYYSLGQVPSPSTV